MKRTLSFLLIMLCILPAFAQDLDQIIYNKPSRLVNDYVATLSQEERQKLEKKLDSFDRKTSTQIAVVLINELKGRKLEETATTLFNNWGIGQRDKNNGLLILAVMQERKVRIEVGRGLESAITNETAARIIQEDIVPAFKEARYFDGLDTATTSLMKLAVSVFPGNNAGTNDQAGILKGELNNSKTPPVHYTAETYNSSKGWNWPAIRLEWVLLIFLLIVIVWATRRIFSNKNDGGVFGSNGYKPVQSEGGQFLGGFPAGWFFSNLFHKHPANAAMFYQYRANNRRNYNSTATSSGTYLGSWSAGGGSNSSSGSTTFGGGSSSGGGASGSW
ncbi:MAG: TPM domain-containing protein [Pseudobacter sp.]|uniref:TPM domain-containing protein n=1 Tax=Pseudobacter sp. TaxID=2045420 RepID=UPI003F7F80FB